MGEYTAQQIEALVKQLLASFDQASANKPMSACITATSVHLMKLVKACKSTGSPSAKRVMLQSLQELIEMVYSDMSDSYVNDSAHNNPDKNNGRTPGVA